LSLEQLEEIFTGRVRNWKDVGRQGRAHHDLQPRKQLGDLRVFQRACAEGQGFCRERANHAGTAALLQAINKDPNGIGYGGAAYGAGARALGVKLDANSKAVQPNEETLLNQTLPIGVISTIT